MNRIKFTALYIANSVEECRGNLIQFGVREINPSSVAKVLGMMARTPAGLDGQNVPQVLIKSGFQGQ